MKFYPSTLLAGILSLSASAHAAFISVDELPTAVSPTSCATCAVTTTSAVDLPYMSAFDMLRYDTASGAVNESWLLRYNLHADSKLTSVVDQSYLGGDGIDTTITPYSGYLWMEVPKTLDFSNPNQFSVYTDKITPDPDNSPDDTLSTWRFSMAAIDAVNGGAGYYNSGDDGSGSPVIERGNLSVLDGIFTCVECGIDVRLNLVGLDYSSGVAGFDFLDNRGLLLEYADFFDYFSDTRTFAVSAVPLPAAFWLFAAGLIGLFSLSRRRQ